MSGNHDYQQKPTSGTCNLGTSKIDRSETVAQTTGVCDTQIQSPHTFEISPSYHDRDDPGHSPPKDPGTWRRAASELEQDATRGEVRRAEGPSRPIAEFGQIPDDRIEQSKKKKKPELQKHLREQLKVTLTGNETIPRLLALWEIKQSWNRPLRQPPISWRMGSRPPPTKRLSRIKVT